MPRISPAARAARMRAAWLMQEGVAVGPSQWKGGEGTAMKPPMTRKYFGTDGIRGRTNEAPMTAEMAQRVGQAAGAHFLRGDHRHRVVIGKDTRLSGYMMETALISGFTSVGMDVVMVGPVPTPAAPRSRGGGRPSPRAPPAREGGGGGGGGRRPPRWPCPPARGAPPPA